MAIKWEWEDERPLTKWISDPTSRQHKKLETISRKAVSTFGCLLYEKTDSFGKSFLCSSIRGDATMTRILGPHGTIEITAESSIDIFMNSFGQSALDRTVLFKRVVSLMNSLGYSDCKYTYAENIGTLWFSVSCASQTYYENAIINFDRVLKQVFGI